MYHVNKIATFSLLNENNFRIKYSYNKRFKIIFLLFKSNKLTKKIILIVVN